jgi:hypothetical protein
MIVDVKANGEKIIPIQSDNILPKKANETLMKIHAAATLIDCSKKQAEAKLYQVG